MLVLVFYLNFLDDKLYNRVVHLSTIFRKLKNIKKLYLANILIPQRGPRVTQLRGVSV